MSRSIIVNLVYGFSTNVALSDEDISDLEKAGIAVSPVCYTTEDETEQYVIGKSIARISQSGQLISVPDNMTTEEKDKIYQWLFKELHALGFDVSERPLSLLMNSYYG